MARKEYRPRAIAQISGKLISNRVGGGSPRRPLTPPSVRVSYWALRISSNDSQDTRVPDRLSLGSANIGCPRLCSVVVFARVPSILFWSRLVSGPHSPQFRTPATSEASSHTASIVSTSTCATFVVTSQLSAPDVLSHPLCGSIPAILGCIHLCAGSGSSL